MDGIFSLWAQLFCVVYVVNKLFLFLLTLVDELLNYQYVEVPVLVFYHLDIVLNCCSLM